MFAWPYLSEAAWEPTSDWEWYFLMQHHGVPTRLLDELWSEMLSELPENLKQDRQRYCKILRDNFFTIRDSLAHGSNELYPTVLGSFELAADLINLLFPEQRT